MQPMPKMHQPVAQQPVRVQEVPAQGQMPIYVNTGKSKKVWGIFTPTPAEWLTSVTLLLGFGCWWISVGLLEDAEAIGAMFFQGLAYVFWFGSIVMAVHAVEKALLNSKK